jgi:hypothetical protein
MPITKVTNPLSADDPAYQGEVEEPEIEVDLGAEDAEAEPTTEEPEDFSANLAEFWPKDIVDALATYVEESVIDDLESRKGLDDQIKAGLEELGLRIEEQNEPFEGACSATHPLLLENIVKYQSKAIQELFPAAGPVKTRIYGAVTPEIEARAARIQEFMNYQILEEMVEYVDETERLLFSNGLIGTSIKKLYFDEALNRPTSEFVPIDQFVVSYNAPDLRRAERYTHILFRTKDEFERDVQNGVYRDTEVGSPALKEVSEIQEKIDQIQGLTAPSRLTGYTIYEHHCFYKGPNDEAASPYIICVDKNSRKTLAVRRNWHPQDQRKQRLDWFVRYLFVPSTSFYGFGLLHLIGSLSKTATEVMRSLVDSGQFANLQGGFKLRNLRVVGNKEDGSIGPGEWKDVDAPNMDISKAILPLPYKEPSQTLYTLLEFVVGAGQKFADTTEQVIADSTNYGPVGTTMALLEASTKFFSALHKRLHASFKAELKILKRINANHLTDPYPYPVEGADSQIRQQDFTDSIDVIPASDPNTPSNAHRVTKATTVLQMAQQAPQLHDMREVYRRTYSAMEIEGVDKLMPQPEPPKPQDPLTDIMSASHGKPIQAFPGQDHDAHVNVKMMFLQDPSAGGSPAFQAIGPIIIANVREHMVLKYVEAAQATGGDQEKATQMVAEMGIMQAQAQAGVLGSGGDPSILLGQMELKQRAQEHKDKTVLDAAGLALKSRELDIREQEQVGKGAVEGLKLKQKDVTERRQLGADLVDTAAKLAIAQQKAVADREKVQAQKAAAKTKGTSNAKQK